MTTVYAVLQADSYGTAMCRGVFRDKAPAEALESELTGPAFKAWIEEGDLDTTWPDRDE